jgi:hypothetical protein
LYSDFVATKNNIVGEIYSRFPRYIGFSDIPEITHLEEIRKIFPKTESSGVNWTRECDTFPLFVQLLQFPVFTKALLSGFIRCAGSVTESLVRKILYGAYLFALYHLR